MTEREVRQQINATEKSLSRLEKQHGKLERLVASTSDRLAKTGDDADAQTLLKARMERDTARQMLEENQAEQAAATERIEALRAQAEKAMLVEEYEAAVTELQAARGKWRQSAEQVVRTLKKVMEEEEQRRRNVTETFQRVEAAAISAGVEIPAEVKYKRLNWSEVPGTTIHGAIETEHMTMSPPKFKTEQVAASAAINNAPRVEPVFREGGHDSDTRHIFHRNNSGDVIPDDRVALSLQTMGLAPKDKVPAAEIPTFEEMRR